MIVTLKFKLNFMKRGNVERAVTIEQGRKAAEAARIDAKTQAIDKERKATERERMAGIAEEAREKAAGAILKESYNAERIADAKARIEAMDDENLGAEVDRKFDEIQKGVPSDREAEVGKALGEAFEKFENK